MHKQFQNIDTWNLNWQKEAQTGRNLLKHKLRDIGIMPTAVIADAQRVNSRIVKAYLVIKPAKRPQLTLETKRNGHASSPHFRRTHNWRLCILSKENHHKLNRLILPQLQLTLHIKSPTPQGRSEDRDRTFKPSKILLSLHLPLQVQLK
jgi:hypothetical protein